ncbi:MAG: hypothetical protein MUE39_08630 [Gammaproteobacteria bacterium]|jgi:hypothetical protein|nr:hypothetical protein [Gammaproteobacteria bacterium]
MIHLLLAGSLAGLLVTEARAAPALSPPDEAAAFAAAGYVKKGAQWRGDCEDPGSASYVPPTIETVQDVNGDGRPEAVIVEGSAFCYGMTGQAFVLVSQQADGSWKQVARAVGVPRFLSVRGTDGWPDLEVGGPGFCFPVQRWNGRQYAQNRLEYQGKPCRRK